MSSIMRNANFVCDATYGMDRELDRGTDAAAYRHAGSRTWSWSLRNASRFRLPTCERNPPQTINEITLRAGFRARLVAPLLARRRRRWSAGGPPPHAWRVPAEHRRPDRRPLQTQSAVAIENARLFRRAWKPVRANWRNRWVICGPRKIAWSRRKSLPRSVN